MIFALEASAAEGGIKTEEEGGEVGVRSIASSLVAFLVKLLSFFREVACGLERRLAHVDPPERLRPSEAAAAASTAEGGGVLGPCQERLRRLEVICQEISNKPAQMPEEKDRVLLDSWDRIKSIEFDLEKTKKVGARHKSASISGTEQKSTDGFSLVCGRCCRRR